MAEWLDRLRVYGPPLLAWVLFATRRQPEDRARRSVRWVVLGLAMSQTALSPVVFTAIGRLSGVADLARLIGHGGMLFVAWSALVFLAHMHGADRPSRGGRWWVVGAFAVMCLLFGLAPDLAPGSPWVLEYWVVYLAGQAPAFGGVVLLCLRHARVARQHALRVGLRMVAVGTSLALVYLVNKVVLIAAVRFGFAHPVADTWAFRALLAPSAHLLVLVGAAMPALLGWLHRYRVYRRLRPLWVTLYRADPAIALDPPTPAWVDALAVRALRLRLYRRVIEIRDGLLALRPYLDPAVAAAARDRATEAGLRGQRWEAAVEAACVAAALGAKSAGTAPVSTTPAVPISGGVDVESDADFLCHLSRAHRGVR